jgi:short-subunit dehydrogenase involved in D-alanine esterification of teichoic acids
VTDSDDRVCRRALLHVLRAAQAAVQLVAHLRQLGHCAEAAQLCTAHALWLLSGRTQSALTPIYLCACQAAETELVKNKGVVINVSSGVAITASQSPARTPYYVAKASQVCHVHTTHAWTGEVGHSGQQLQFGWHLALCCVLTDACSRKQSPLCRR